MDEKKQTENTDYQFIKEKVVSKKKNKIRRGALSLCFVIFLAVVFGIVARLTFLTSEEPMKKLLGIPLSPTELPTPTMTPTPTPAPSPTPEPSVTPELTVTAEPTPTEGIDEEKPTVSPESAALENYLLAFEQIRLMAGEVQKSLLAVHAFESGTDWLDTDYATESLTSGLILELTEENLFVLVNLDRVQSANRITVEYDRTQFDAELWRYDKEYNLAVIRVDRNKMTPAFCRGVQPAVFGESETLKIGTPVAVLGNPNGYFGSMELGAVTSRGSLYYITDNSVELFNIDTSGNLNGDGIVVNLSGEIVGIITRTMKDPYNGQLCTAMGITRLNNRIKKLISKEDVRYFGIRGENVPVSVLTEQGLVNGIYVKEVLVNSPAFEAGIKTGDILLQLGENKIFSYSGFYAMLETCEIGEEVMVTLHRTVRMNSELVVIPVVISGR